MSPAKDVNFLYLCKGPALSFIDLFFCFLGLKQVSFVAALILMISTNFGFCLFFLWLLQV